MEWLGCLAVIILLIPLGLLVWLLRLQARLRQQDQAISDLQVTLATLDAHVRRGAPSIPEEELEPGGPQFHADSSSTEQTPSHRVLEPTPPAGPLHAETPPEDAPSRDQPPNERPPEPPPPLEAETTSPPSPLPPKRPKVEWERWLGVRGAAVLGAGVLALAAILFLKYSIEAGLIPPVVRVAFGYLAGVAALVASEQLRRRRYIPVANGLAGSGVVTLYGATWAARTLYDLLPFVVAFALMALITAVGGLISWRHRSLVVASLGTVGGFATPLLLASEKPNPIGLFGYLLLLNLGVWLVARRNGWPWLALLAQLGTFGYQLLWIGFQMEPGSALLGIAILGVFAVLFVALGERGRNADDSQASPRALPQLAYPLAGLVTPFTLAFYYATRSELLGDPLALFGLLVLVSGLAAWLALVHRLPAIALAAAAADLGLLVAWSGAEDFDLERSWQLAGASLAMAAVFHLQLEWRARRGRSTSSTAVAMGWFEAAPAALAAGAFALWSNAVLLLDDGAAFWPWLLSVLALAALLFRQGALSGWVLPPVLASTSLGLGLLVPMARHALAAGSLNPGTPSAETLHLLAIALGALLLGHALMRHRGLSVTLGARGTETPFAVAAIVPLLVLLPILGARGLEPALFFVLTGLLAMLLVLGATAARSGLLYTLAVGLLWTNHLAWLAVTERARERTGVGLVAMALTVLVFTLWPVLTAHQWRPAADTAATGPAWRGWGWRLTWISAALAGPLWFLPLGLLWTQRWRDGAIGLLPLALGALALIVVLRARTLPFGRPALIWSSAVALCAIAAAIPLQLDREWITVSWSLQAFAVLLLWRRLRHPGLALFALLLHSAVAIRLLLNPALLSYHQTGALPVLNWLAYTYLVPAAALVASARLLARGAEGGEPASADSPSRLDRVWRLAAGGCAAAAIVLVFAWINLTIIDAFSTGRRLTFDLERLPARDLTLSLAWTLYGLGLLATGMARKAVVLRWISLAFLILTIAKVFLYDLGELTDLYRVASLVGLAVSLILVSLLYQRFVFGTGDGDGQADEAQSEEKS